MTLPSYRDIAPKAERTFSLWGPNSGGGASVLLADGVLYEVVYGDASRSEGGAEEIWAVHSPDDFARLFATDPQRVQIVAYLRERGLLGQGVA